MTGERELNVICDNDKSVITNRNSKLNRNLGSMLNDFLSILQRKLNNAEI